MTELVVVGDVLLDRDIVGSAERLCPDAPVPVVDIDEELCRPGGAGLAAVIAATASASAVNSGAHSSGTRPDVTLLSAFGDDPAGRTTAALLASRGVRVLDLGDGGQTPEKIRVRSGGQSLVRLDRGSGASVGSPTAAIWSELASADAVLVSDYGRGVAAHPEVRALLDAVRRRGMPVVWDPHPRGPDPIAGATLVTPNDHECRTRWPDAERPDTGRPDAGRPGASNPDIRRDGLASLVARARTLRTRWRATTVAVTCGEHGAVAVTGDGAALVIAVPERFDGIDTCGAGDAFAVAAAIALGRGAALSDALETAVHGGTAHLARGGAVAAATSGEERAPFGSPDPRVEASRGDQRVVATGGCFDVLHPGHLDLVTRARRLGDRLVVLLNSDESVRRLKGPDRPVHRQRDRSAALRGLRDVDEVVVFDEDTPVEALRRLRPQIFVKGGDYTATELPEAAVLAEWGGVAVTVPYLPGHSTTGLLTHGSDAEVSHVG